MKPSSDSKLVIIVMGPPGAGKGTQAELLAQSFNLYHFETSEIIEKNLKNITEDDFVIVENKKYFLAKEKKLRDSGKWMSPPLIVFWVQDRIKSLAERGEGIVVSGSPKTLYEAKKITPLLKELYGISNIKVILIQQSVEESIWRNSHRRICELMRHPILYNKETEKLTRCPIDGSKLITREDTNPEIIKSKFKEFENRSLPIIDYFQKENLKIEKIDGSPPPVEVFQSILKALKLK